MDFSNRINYIELDNDSLFKAMFLEKRCRKMVSAVLSRITNISDEKILNAKFIGGVEFPKSHKLEKKKISDIVINVKRTIRLYKKGKITMYNFVHVILVIDNRQLYDRLFAKGLYYKALQAILII